ncbi:hypothetical protein NCLIV_028480 [Neospora caninum Liverpool]|uniref:Histone lysine methyltransferase SET2 n=1 Tax=Neospora caninum (strain Liverpool) TaxID=572307 RepID=F0VH65_NEOCL|nr:hypothetical protein NCLIV_028480 [Neospora caninum Liverpool]CBZ53059.1 hypothetical protein NCLIV_028480 [Neospora caninum Liverpool]CEL67042.1 TPA: histone lysine methyltransferase SET2 [Neospora caninum Liverpool]|eukprot:XP_003883091.1 hypothetical protein NCLIV_028480 [Neospora caninum Liverpool]
MPKELRRAAPLAGRPRALSPSLHSPSKGAEFLHVQVDVCAGAEDREISQQIHTNAPQQGQTTLTSPQPASHSPPCSSVSPSSSLGLSSSSPASPCLCQTPLASKLLSAAPAVAPSSSLLSSFCSSSSVPVGARSDAGLGLRETQAFPRSEKAQNEEDTARREGSAPGAAPAASPPGRRLVTGRGRKGVNRIRRSQERSEDDIEVQISSSDDDAERGRVLALLHAKGKGKKAAPSTKGSGAKNGARDDRKGSSGERRGSDCAPRPETEEAREAARNGGEDPTKASAQGDGRDGQQGACGLCEAKPRAEATPGIGSASEAPRGEGAKAKGRGTGREHVTGKHSDAERDGSCAVQSESGAEERVEAAGGSWRHSAATAAKAHPVHTRREAMGRDVEQAGDRARESQQAPGGARKRGREERRSEEERDVREGETEAGGPRAEGQKRLRETSEKGDGANPAGQKQEQNAALHEDGEDVRAEQEAHLERAAPCRQASLPGGDASPSSAVLPAAPSVAGDPGEPSPLAPPDLGDCDCSAPRETANASEASFGASLCPRLSSENAVVPKARETFPSHACSREDAEGEPCRSEEAALFRFQKKMETLAQEDLGTAHSIAVDTQGAVRVFHAALWLEHLAKKREKRAEDARGNELERTGEKRHHAGRAGVGRAVPGKEAKRDQKGDEADTAADCEDESENGGGRAETGPRQAPTEGATGQETGAEETGEELGGAARERPEAPAPVSSAQGEEAGGGRKAAERKRGDNDAGPGSYYDSDCDSMYGEGADLDPVDESVQNALLGDRENDVISLVEAWRNIQQLCRSVGSRDAIADVSSPSRSSPPVSCDSPAPSPLSKEERAAVRSQAYRQLPPRVWNDNLELHCAVCERVNHDPHTTTMLVCEAYCQRAFHPACVGLGNLELDWADEDELRSRAFSFQCEDCCDEVLRCSACGLRKPRRQLSRCSHMLCRRFYCWPACVEATVHISPFQSGPLVPSLRADDLQRLTANRGACANSLLNRRLSKKEAKHKHRPVSGVPASAPSADAGGSAAPTCAENGRSGVCAAEAVDAKPSPETGDAGGGSEESDAQRASATAEGDREGQDGLRKQVAGAGDAERRPGKGVRPRQKEQKKARREARAGGAPSLLFASRESHAERNDAEDGQGAEANRLVEAARILYEAGEDVFFDAQGRERFICSRHFCVSCHTLETQHFTWETHLRQLAYLADDLQLAVPSLSGAAPERDTDTGTRHRSSEDALATQGGSRQAEPVEAAFELEHGNRSGTRGHLQRRGRHHGRLDVHGGRAAVPGKPGDSVGFPQCGAVQARGIADETPGSAWSSATASALVASPQGDAPASQMAAVKRQLAFARVCFDFVKESTRGWTDRRIFAKQYKLNRPDPFPSLLVSPLVDIWECQLCRAAFCSRCVPPASKILSDASGSILCDFCRFSASWKRRKDAALGPYGGPGEARHAPCRGADEAGERGRRDGRRRKGRKARKEEEERRIAEMIKDVVVGADCMTSLTTNFRRFLRAESSTPGQSACVAAPVRVIDDRAWESCALLEDEPGLDDAAAAAPAVLSPSASASSASGSKGLSSLSAESARKRLHGAPSRNASVGEAGESGERKRRKARDGERGEAGSGGADTPGAKPSRQLAAGAFGADRLNFQFTTSCIFPAQCRNLLRARSEGEMCVCAGRTCDADCLNRSRGIQCDRKRCKFGPVDCGNRQFKRGGGSGSQAFCFVQDCGEKGLGVFARERIEEGKLVIEYVGEVLDSQLLAARVRAYTQQELVRGQPQHWYVMEVIPHVYIDSTRVGNIARLVNHSCEPNCSLQRVNVHGTYRMGIFALRPILPGEEISYDYGFTRKGFGQGFVCFCGSSKCRGRIGGDSRRNKFGDVADNALKRKEGFDTLLCKQLCQAITSQSFSRAERIPPPSPYTWRRDGVGTSAQARAWLEKKLAEGEADNPFFAQFIFDFHLYDAAVNFVKLLLLDGKTVEEFARSKTKSMCMDIPWSLLASDFNDKGMTQAIRHSILTEERLNKAKKFFLSNMAIRAAVASGRSAQTALQDLVDLNWGATEVCSLCDSEGVVSVCDSCAEAYHADCAELSQDDEGHSLCPACLLSDSRRQWHLMSEAQRVHVGVRLNALRLLEALAKSPHQQLFPRQDTFPGDLNAGARDRAKGLEKVEDETEGGAGSLVSKRNGRTDASKKGGKGSVRSGNLGHEKGRNGAAEGGGQTFPVLAGSHVDDIWSVFTLQDEEEALFFEAGYVEE